MNLDADTLIALDWPVLVDALAERARTPLGAQAARALQALGSVEAIRRAHDAIDELMLLQEAGSDMPVGAVDDVRTPAIRAEKGERLDGSDLRRVGQTLGALRDLDYYLQRYGDDAPTLARLGEPIFVDDVLADELLVAFENTGELSSRTYPELGDLRRRIADLHTSIRATLQTLLRSDELTDLLQDEFVTQRNDRYVLPIKSHAKRWDLGIVHGTSGSGQTVYIEPKQVVEINNRLRIAESELEQAERRILIRLSADVGRSTPTLLASLTAVSELDLCCARQALAADLRATRPKVGETGVITLHRARHPVLVLRGVDVIDNDLALGPKTPALVLSGPNAGGKTVSLKTIGLCALLVRIGCFVPAAEGSQVDRFGDVLAAIGDAQSVQGDLSSFSGHLLVLNAMMDRAAPGTLLLLDEIASGTDPAQGAALAQAVLERMLDQGPRIVVTTHFARLKALPAADERFASAAVEYADGRPTYRVVSGALGESHALSIAARMGFDDALLDRSRALMDTGDRELAAVLEKLDQATTQAEAARRTAQDEAARLSAREAELARREQVLRSRAKELEEKAAAGFIDRLSGAEKAISAVIADLQRDPSHKKAQAARATLDALRDVVPQVPPEAIAPADIQVGDHVVLRSSGWQGEVLSVSGTTAQVRTGAVTVKVDLDQLAPAAAPPPPVPSPSRKSRRPNVTPKAPRQTPLEDAVRTPANTLDLRGQRADASIEAIETFIDKALMAGRDYVFVLHGHGTGALKAAVRRWLASCRTVEAWSPASEDQGGDAYTVLRIAG